MRDTLQLVVRKGGKVKTSLSRASVITELFNPALYDGANKDLLDLLSSHAVETPEAVASDLCAPAGIGLLVFDMDRRCVLEMQSWCDVQTSSLIRQQRPWHHVASAGQRGWLGSHLYNAFNDQLLTPFPDDLFASTEGLRQWAESALDEIVNASEGRPPLASFKLQPAGWTFREFAQGEAEAVQQYLHSLGFEMCERTKAAWSSWQIPR